MKCLLSFFSSLFIKDHALGIFLPQIGLGKIFSVRTESDICISSFYGLTSTMKS